MDSDMFSLILPSGLDGSKTNRKEISAATIVFSNLNFSVYIYIYIYIAYEKLFHHHPYSTCCIILIVSVNIKRPTNKRF